MPVEIRKDPVCGMDVEQGRAAGKSQFGEWVSPGKALVDLGCGMGGAALWVARQTEARLPGVDLSALAVAQATARATALRLAELATLIRGTFADTGLRFQPQQRTSRRRPIGRERPS